MVAEASLHEIHRALGRIEGDLASISEKLDSLTRADRDQREEVAQLRSAIWRVKLLLGVSLAAVSAGLGKAAGVLPFLR